MGEETEFRCVRCGKVILSSQTKGSIQHPYCKKCFKKVWNNDDKKYNTFLITHDTLF